MKTKSNKITLDIIKQRLGMQSLKRILTNQNLPSNLDYFLSNRFAREFNSWHLLKQKEFLGNVAGIYANQFREIIESSNKLANKE